MYLMISNAINNTYFPEKDSINDMLYFQTKKHFAGHLYYFATFLRKAACIFVIVFLRKGSLKGKVPIYVFINILWLAYAVLGDPFRTKIAKIVTIINEIGYIVLILISYTTLENSPSSYKVCISMIFRIPIGIIVVNLLKVILYILSPYFIDTVKYALPFEIRKNKKVHVRHDHDITPVKHNHREMSKPVEHK